MTKTLLNITAMKRFNSPWGVATVLFTLLLTSMVFNFKFINMANAQRATINTLQTNNYKLEEYKEALKLADIIFDRNDVWDMDGGDEMADYLNLRANMDSTFDQSALLDSIKYNYYNE